MFEIEYLNEEEDTIKKELVWNKDDADKLLKKIDNDKNLILLAINNNLYK